MQSQPTTNDDDHRVEPTSAGAGAGAAATAADDGSFDGGAAWLLVQCDWGHRRDDEPDPGQPRTAARLLRAWSAVAALAARGWRRLIGPSSVGRSGTAQSSAPPP